MNPCFFLRTPFSGGPLGLGLSALYFFHYYYFFLCAFRYRNVFLVVGPVELRLETALALDLGLDCDLSFVSCCLDILFVGKNVLWKG